MNAEPANGDQGRMLRPFSISPEDEIEVTPEEVSGTPQLIQVGLTFSHCVFSFSVLAILWHGICVLTASDQVCHHDS